MPSGFDAEDLDFADDFAPSLADLPFALGLPFVGAIATYVCCVAEKVCGKLVVGEDAPKLFWELWGSRSAGLSKCCRRQAPRVSRCRQLRRRDRNSSNIRLASFTHTSHDPSVAHTGTMEDNRLFRFPRPAWLNSANTRTFGVYTAGALVGITKLSNLTSTILIRTM
jgi:hypothetical protein